MVYDSYKGMWRPSPALNVQRHSPRLANRSGKESEYAMRYKRLLIGLALLIEVILWIAMAWVALYPEILTAVLQARAQSAEQRRLRLASRAQAETELVVTQETMGEWQVYRTGLDFYWHWNGDLQWKAPGQLWLIDGKHLVRFDGQHWYDCKSSAVHFGHYEFRGLGVSDDQAFVSVSGSLSDGGLAIYDLKQKQWSMLWPGESELSGSGVYGLAIDPQGRAYLPTAANYLDIYDHGQWSHIPIPVPEERVIFSGRAGVFDAQGNFWLSSGSGTSAGIWKYDAKSWEVYPLPIHANGVAVDSVGRLWAGTSNGLVLRGPAGDWYHYSFQGAPWDGGTIPTDGFIHNVALDPAGRLWAVTESAVWIFNGRDWQAFSPQVIGADRWSGGIAFDSEGRPWLAADHGRVAVFQGQVDLAPFSSLTDPPPMRALRAYELTYYSPRQTTEDENSFLMQRLLIIVMLISLTVVIIRTAESGWRTHPRGANGDFGGEPGREEQR